MNHSKARKWAGWLATAAGLLTRRNLALAGAALLAAAMAGLRAAIISGA
jgi:hypothetical protein